MNTWAFLLGMGASIAAPAWLIGTMLDLTDTDVNDNWFGVLGWLLGIGIGAFVIGAIGLFWQVLARVPI